MEAVLGFLYEAVVFVGAFCALLGLLVFVHELGHFAVAKWCGVRVETFSLGFGPKILKCVHRGTVYCVSLVPLGGYVKMFGDDPSTKVKASERGCAFLHQPLWKRVSIVLAGPLMNLLFAAWIFALLGAMGFKVPGTHLGYIAPNTKAFEAGFRTHDHIVQVGGRPVRYWSQVAAQVEAAHGKGLEFAVMRKKTLGSTAAEAQETPQRLVVRPELGENPFIFSAKTKVGVVEGLSASSRPPILAMDLRESALVGHMRALEYVVRVNSSLVPTFTDLMAALKALPLGKEARLEILADHTQWTRGRFAAGDTRPTRTVRIESWQGVESLALRPQELFLYQIAPRSPAQRAGLQFGDLLLALNGQELKNWQGVLKGVSHSFNQQGAKSVELLVLRGTEPLRLSILPEMTKTMRSTGRSERRYTIGIVPAIFDMEPLMVERRETGLNALAYGARQSWEWTGIIAISFWRLIQGRVTADNIGGVISIGVVAKQSFVAGIRQFLKMMAIISINLFLLNLLPVPVLDGGHLVYFFIEFVKGSPLSVQNMQRAQQVGVVLLVGLMAFALFNDIVNLIGPY